MPSAEVVDASTSGRIVGIGASAGGLESLERLFSNVPADTGLAFIVVQHLSPDFRSLMDELIARHSEMPVVIAEDGMPVRANHIYLMPPRKEMIIRERQLVLTDKEPHTFTLPIDTFFRSLAQDVGDQAVAVVLSGSGTDGSRGIIDVKRAGGLVIAEGAITAKFDGMPVSAAATGVVDHIHAPEDIARVLRGLPPMIVTEDESLNEDPAMDAVLRMLRDQSGIDFSLYKTTTVGRRIQRRVDLMRFSDLAAYVERLRTEPDELDALYQDLLIGVTQFFRDPAAFEMLEKEILPKLIDQVPPNEEIRVWIAGCATGEEAYSLAMLFWEILTAKGRPIRIKILATDVHQQSLDVAGAGIYGEEQLTHVSAQRLQRFFTRRSSGYQISQDLRSLIVFARHNVTKDAPFTKMHFISCRNMLIYLQPHAQRTVMSLFHFGLASNGVMFLGASESPGPLADEFTTLDDHWKIYRKRRDVQLLNHVRLPMNRQLQRRPATLDLPRSSSADPMMLHTYDQLLDRFMPPGFLVDEDRNLIDSFAGAERLLAVRRRRPSQNVIDLVHEDLRPVLAGAIQRAARDRVRVAYSGVRIPLDSGEVRCTITAEPLQHPRTGMRHVLITFLDVTGGDLARRAVAAEATPAPPLLGPAEASRERLDTLESELAYTRETLQATIEELETSNEEMQATNEELVASNEELQSTNEELHSVNEELYTVNAEYQQKIVELKELNTDMTHLLEGTDVGTVFLDRELRIRRFTSRIATVFRFQQADIGRTISDFSHNIVRPALMDEIETVRRAGTTIEDEVRDRNGTSFFLRVLPYRMPDSPHQRGPSSIDGVVITLTEMTALDKARTRLAQLSAIVESSDDAIVGKQLDGTITTWNRGAQQMYGYTADEIIGRNVRMLMAPGSENELDGVVERIRRGERIEHKQSFRVTKDGRHLDVSVTISPIYDVEGELVGLSAIGRDISAMIATQKRIATLLEQTEEVARRREQFLAMLSHELRNPLAAVINATSLLEHGASPDRIDHCQRVIDRQAKHMRRLLDDLLDVSRITRGKFELRSEDLDLRRPLDAAVESVAPLFEQRGVTLVTEIPQIPLPVRGDSNRLMQVAVNLLSNAANYSPRNSKVRLVASIEGNAAVMRVIDHGVGIELELQERIFDLFVQSEQRLDRSRGGLGVGLSLAKNIVELHGGSIEVNSEGPGKGADFKVTLPLARSTVVSPPSLVTKPRAERRRIVIVDDQDDSREMLKMLLESRDHHVADAADGPSALELITREQPDVAFIDIGLPVMTGYEIAQRIRAQKDLDHVRLVALTGYGAPSDINAARDAGFDDHIIKPAELRRLEAILQRKPEN